MNSALRQKVIGIGNAQCGDDAVGRKVAQILRGQLPESIEVVELDGEPTALLASLDGADATFLVDACHSGAKLGTVRRFDVSGAPLPQMTFGLSTHALGLAEAIELARALGQLPPHCMVFAIEGARFAAGLSMSPAVARAVPEVVRRVKAEIVGNLEGKEAGYA